MNPTAKSLLAQMQIHEIEIARRKQLLEFGARDVDLLVSCRDFIQREVETLVATFYEKQTADDEIALIIGDADTLTRLRAAMTRYTIDLFSGFYDAEYVNNRLRIGLVHKRIGVAPKHYLSAMRILKGLLFDAISRHRHGHPDLAATLQALDKLLYFDTEFVFDTYIRSLLAELESAKDHAVQYALDLEEKVLARTRELEEFSRRDPLTGLYNQRTFMETLRRELARVRRSGHGLALLYLDVDRFKQINDAHGHLAGDEVLRSIGHVLSAMARHYDTCCRYGGDEFCVILPETGLEGAREFALRLLQAMPAHDGEPVRMSIGIALADGADDEDTNSLLARADSQMYAAKAAGGGRACADAAARPGANLTH
ncbi:MAG: GGDEF domain-containing protein [Burkholderiales bacterium]|nr:GGDEF domain-containing protein [Burkholderiales bacterium]MDE2455032.1 GGDEF domain-containing protein [Burkholderiales bacterium]